MQQNTESDTGSSLSYYTKDNYYDDYDSYMEDWDDFCDDYNAWTYDDFDCGDGWEEWQYARMYSVPNCVLLIARVIII